MRPLVIVVLHVLAHGDAQMGLPEHNRLAQALALDRQDKPVCKSVQREPSKLACRSWPPRAAPQRAIYFFATSCRYHRRNVGSQSP